MVKQLFEILSVEIAGIDTKTKYLESLMRKIFVIECFHQISMLIRYITQTALDTQFSIRQFPSPEHPYIAFPQKNLAVLDISRFTFCKVDYKENGDLRTVIVDLLLNDDAVTQTIINAVSDALVSTLLASKDVMATLADKLLSHGALDTLKQSVYEASATDNSRTYASVTAMKGKLSALDSNNEAPSDEMDALEQYSRRNCLLSHGDRRSC